MSTYIEADHPRGGNPANPGQWSTKQHAEGAVGVLSRPHQPDTSDGDSCGGGDVYQLARSFDIGDLPRAETTADHIAGRGYWSAVEHVRIHDPGRIVDGELDPDSTSEYLEVHAFDSAADRDDWLGREAFHPDIEQVDHPEMDYATSPSEDPYTGRVEDRNLQTFDPDPAIPDQLRASFPEAHTQTMLWAEPDTDGEPLDATYTAADVSSEAAEEAQADLDDFVDDNNPLLTRLAQDHPDYDLSRLPHDFHLSRNGHGSGFWDRGLGEVGDKLHEATRPYGSFCLVVGDDGQLHAA